MQSDQFFWSSQILYQLDKNSTLFNFWHSVEASFVIFQIISWTLCGFFGGTQQPPPRGPGPPHYWELMITLRHTTLGRIPLDEWSARRRDLYLTHNTHNRQTSMSPAGFEPAIPSSERQQNHVLDRSATGTDTLWKYSMKAQGDLDLVALHFL